MKDSNTAALAAMRPGEVRKIRGVKVHRLAAAMPLFCVGDQPARFMSEMVSVLDDKDSRIALGAKE